MPDVPQYCPTPRELDDLELLATGALAPIARFGEEGSPVTLTLPDAVDAAAREAGAVELVDPEGLPLARVTWPEGAVEPLTHAQYGPFRDRYLTPSQVRERYAGRAVVPVTDALTTTQLADLAGRGPLLLLALVGTGTPALSPVALIRATLRAADLLPDAAVVAVPLAAHGDAEADHALGVQVVATYAGPDPVLALPDTDDDSEHPASIAEVVEFDQPDASEQGLVLFFTGLSGSGKSTLARALMDRILEQGTRTLTSLDGDVVRRNLSAGLSFSKEDRETNIRRIGWVAAEIARHGGVAVCSPIAPFDETRQQVRQMVDDAGGAFFLVHVATPLEECERRDRKGLYAKARRGEIPEFTGISSPYEEPQDADVRVDTTGRTIEAALDDVLLALREAGYLDLTSRAEPVEPVETTPVVEEVAQRPSRDRGGPEPLAVLFVCTANICRSPTLELLARQLARAAGATHVEFASAGTMGFDAHPVDDDVAATLTARGVPGVERFRSRRLTGDLITSADLVLTAEAAHRTFVLDDHPARFRTVFTLGQFAHALSQHPTDATGRDLIAHVAAHRGSADTSLDLPDPYRRGPEAAEASTTHLESLLRAVLPGLIGSEKLA